MRRNVPLTVIVSLLLGALRMAGGLVEARWALAEWAAAVPSRLVTTVERRLSRQEDEHEGVAAGAGAAAAEVARANARLGQGFEHDQQLAVAQRRQREIAELLIGEAAPAREQCRCQRA